MLVENQMISITWTTSNYKYYISKGYKFTKIKDKLIVKAEDISHGSQIKIKVECDYCGKIIEKICRNYYIEISKQGKASCNKCKGKKIAYIQKDKVKEEKITLFNRLCEEKGYIPLSTIEDYDGVKAPLKFLCPTHGEQTIYLDSLKNGCGCKLCGRQRMADSHRLSIDYVTSFVSSKNNSILLNPDDYINAHIRNLRVKCGTCGEIYVTSLKNYKWINTGKCPKCDQAQSRAENIIELFLKKYGVNFISEKRFEDCKDKITLPFDFYLPDFNTCIEYDGEHHYYAVFGEEQYKRTVYHDQIKDSYCKSHDIELIRIPYWNFNNIENILFTKLNIEKIA